jgi:small-conductance mechanosensitive channel
MFQAASPNPAFQGVSLLGVHFVGTSSASLHKLLLTGVLVAATLIGAAIIRALSRLLAGSRGGGRPRFWIAQIVRLLVLAIIVGGAVSIWFDSSGRLATMLGWVAAGVAIALQRVITAFAGYLIILRGNVFTVGDRITIGGVRGDVVKLGFMQTTVMEMGEAPGEQSADPAMWVRARQYSGRLVRVTNDKIFDAPVYNYTREFPYFWEEIHIPVRYADDYHVVERIMLDAAHTHTDQIVAQGEPAFAALKRRVFLSEQPEFGPRVYIVLTDNWNSLTVRFLVRDHGARDVKNAISRDILTGLQEAGIGIASTTAAIVEVPPLRVRAEVARPG